MLTKEEPILVTASSGSLPSSFKSEYMELSIMDMVISRFPIKLLYAFPAPSTPASEHYTFAKMKRALADVLTEYPFLAGRMKYETREMTPESARIHTSSPLQMKVHLNNAGVLFTAAKCIDPAITIDSLFPRGSAVIDFVTLPAGISPGTFTPFTDTHNGPLLEVQVTLLACGGMIVGVHGHHGLLDGEAAFRFMDDWGKAYRGVAREPLCYDRFMLAEKVVGDKLGEVKFKHAEYDVPPPKQQPASNDTTDGTGAPAPAAVKWEMPAMTCKVYRFSSNFLKQLKSALSPTTPGTPQIAPFISTKDALTAYLTTLITKARAQVNRNFFNADDLVSVNTGVNGRKRFNPPMPKRYAGNVVFNAFSSHPVTELLSDDESKLKMGMSATAQRIRKEVGPMGNEYFFDAVSMIATKVDDPRDVALAAKYFLGKDVLMTAWAGDMGLSDADFGYGIAYAGPPFLYGDGITVMLDSRIPEEDKKAIEVFVSLRVDVMEAFDGLNPVRETF
jgi:hypothetical protein